MQLCQIKIELPPDEGACTETEGEKVKNRRMIINFRSQALLRSIQPPAESDYAKMRYLNFFTQNTWQSRSNNILYLSIEKAQLIFDPLAQSVEHLTFNQGVRSSNLRWITKGSLQGLLFSLCFYCGGAVYGCNIVQIPTDYRIYLLKCVLLLW